MNHLTRSLYFLLFTTTGFADDLTEHPTIQALFQKNAALRTKTDLIPQQLSDSLVKAAQDHAWYMARMHDKGEEDFNHCGGNKTPGQRAAAYGYEGVVKENLARNYTTIDKTFAAWLDSPGHRSTIFSDTTQVGFGYAIAKDGTTYWVAVYGKPK
jgi:uncharacterized protein YkwD